VRIVATLESVADADGREIWASPDVRERLWEALRVKTTAR
jgi:hypothetical protein